MQRKNEVNNLPMLRNKLLLEQSGNKTAIEPKQKPQVIDVDARIVDDDNAIYRWDFTESKIWLADRIYTLCAGMLFGFAIAYWIFN